MNIKKLGARLGVTAAAIGIAAATVFPATATSNIKPFGHPETLLDPVTGAPQITYTVEGLNPSSDAIPHNGQLYEAVVNSTGGVPVVLMFNARAESGANYRVIGGGIPGKIYFDVVGDVPNSVVYNDGSQDLLVWVATTTANHGFAPEGPGESTEIIGGAEQGGAEAASQPAAPAVVPAPEVISPYETPEQHDRGR